jgi:Protein of unknown function (DUF4239)
VSPVLVIAILVVAVALALGGLVLARRVEGGWWKDPGRAAGVLGAARGPFAVILAFVIFIAFQGFNDARRDADQEASATRRMFKESDLIEGLVRPQIQANLICYARGVIALDWPAMRGGGSSEDVDDTVALLDDQFQIVHNSGAEGPAIDAIFADAAARDQARADRVAEAEGEIPGPVWIVLVLGAVSVLAYVILFADPAERFVPQAVMVGSVTVVIVGGLLLVWFLSHPFRDEMGSIKPSSMEGTLNELQTDPAFRRETSLPLNCDAEGRPSTAATS